MVVLHSLTSEHVVIPSPVKPVLQAHSASVVHAALPRHVLPLRMHGSKHPLERMSPARSWQGRLSPQVTG
eukprot:3445539-Rhodomonas_salina.1